MAKKSKKNVYIVLGVILFILILGLGTWFFGVREAQFVDQPASYTSYTCPQGYNCIATPILECKTSSSSKVIARVDDSDYSSGWVAYDNGFGGLESWSKTGYLAHSEYTTGKVNLPYGKVGFFITSGTPSVKRLYVYDKSSGDNIYYYRYELGSGANLNPSPLFGCQNQELCSGALYSCSMNVYKNTDNNLLQTLTYSRSTPSTSSTESRGVQRALDGGEKIYGLTGTGKLRIETAIERKTTDTCTVNDKPLNVDDKICSSNNILTTCKIDINTNNAEPSAVTLSGQCCLSSTSCDDKDSSTTNTCEANVCKFTKISGYCATTSECTSPKICNNNKCEYPTTGDWCTSAENGKSRCSTTSNTVEECRTYTGGGYKWQKGTDCTAINKICG